MIDVIYDAPVPNVRSNAGGHVVAYPLYVTWYYLLENEVYPVSASQIYKRVPKDKHVSRPKVAQCLKRLAECGYFTRDSVGRGYVYTPSGLFLRVQALWRDQR